MRLPAVSRLALFLLALGAFLLALYRRSPSKGTKQVILLTRMRSGSSFAGHLLAAADSTFYTEEPVREFLGLRPSPEAVPLLRDICLCRFSSRPDYYRRRTSGMHNHDQETLRFCQQSLRMCEDPTTSEVLCRAARVRLTRVVALELGAVGPLMRDPELEVHIVHLIRDPRGTLASRGDLRRYFEGEERSPAFLCGSHRKDLEAAAIIRAAHPDRYTLLRYEDLSLQPSQQLRRLYGKLGLPYTPAVAEDVARHTLGHADSSSSSSNSYGTHRNSTATAFRWRTRLSFQEVLGIQEHCRDVMEALGYRTFDSQNEYQDTTLNVLLPYFNELSPPE